MSEQNKLTRRDFIKGAAALSASVATAGLLTNTAQAAAPIPTKWDKEVDVVVVGAGVGMAAAIEAKTAGADVVVVEKGDHVGGLWMTAGGSCSMGGNNVVQQRDGVKDDDEAWYQDEMWASEYRGQPEIMRALIARGAETIKWMQDLGIVWAPIAAGVLRPPIKRGVQPAQAPGVYAGGLGTPNSGICWTQVWEKKLKAQGVPILLKHRMTRIYRDGTGPVVGIEIKNETGTINVKARKGVILCAGTWTDNNRMAQAWDPRIVGPDTYGDGGTPADGKLYVDSSGDGHLAAAEVGAGFSDMSFVSYIYLFYGSRSYWGWGADPVDWTTNKNYAAGKGLPRTADFFQRVILVKNDGARWINEAEGAKPSVPGRGGWSEWPEWPYTSGYLSLPQPRNVWAVADADTAAALKWPIEDMKKANPKVGLMFDPACLAIADSLEELGKKIGVDPAKLQETINKYNGFVDAGKDTDFGKPMPLSKIAKPPFYAAKASVIRHTQRNGLRVNTKSQVLEQADQMNGQKAVSIDQEKTIPHLYAAGELGNALGWRRVHNSLGHYTTAARIAGENAAKETGLPSI
ncbi:MAG: FAD-dependent oxidoreductase [Chloroflexi bacterium]|nr:FAD-dependent oxidoreductase [Chloroflexota bacterium]